MTLPGSVIAVVNMKGGVGKTTTVVSLSETLAALIQEPILVIDVDAQASASYCLAGDKALTELIQQNRTVDAYFESALINGPRRPIEELICGQVSDVTHTGNNLNVSLLASSAELRITEREIIYNLTAKGYSLNAIEGQTQKILNEDIERLRAKYKFILFDCAPGISAFTSAAVAVADLVIVPTIPDFLSHLGLTSFVHRVLLQVRKNGARLPHVLITKKKATTQHDDYVQRIRQVAALPDARFRMFDVLIKETSAYPDRKSVV